MPTKTTGPPPQRDAALGIRRTPAFCAPRRALCTRHTNVVARHLRIPHGRWIHGPGKGGMKSLLSIVVPCFNEAEVLWETHDRLLRTLTQLTDLDLEIIYVDDG